MTDRAGPRRRSGWWGAAVLLGCLLVAGWWSLPPAVVPASAPDDAASAERAVSVLDDVIGDVGPHPVGTPAARTVEARVVARLRALGLHPIVEPQVRCVGTTCTRVRNVIARIPGFDRDAEPIGLMAHYDSVVAGPGYGDDGSGVATLLEITRVLRAGPPRRRDVVVIFNEGEEAGLWGAQALVRTPLGESLGVVVNVEARGTAGRSYLFEIAGDSGLIAEPYAATARAPAGSSLYVAIYRLLPNNTDVTVLADNGIPAANLAFLDNGHLYHTPLDDRAHLDSRSVQHHLEQALGLLDGLHRADLGRSATHEVFFDLLGLVVVRWPMMWTLPITLGTLAALVLAAGLALRRVRWWHPLAALAVVVAFVVVTVGLGWGTDRLVDALGGSARHAPGLATGGHWLAGFAGVVGLGALGAGLARESLWIALGVLWGGLTLGLAVYLPEGVFLGLLPAWGATMALAVRGLTRDPVATGIGDLLGALPLVAWLHLALGLPTALGVLAPVVAGGVAVALVGFLPWFSACRAPRDGPGLTVLVLLAVLATGLRFASYAPWGPTESRPDGIMAELSYVHPSDDPLVANTTWPTPGPAPEWPGSAPTAEVEPPGIAVERRGDRIRVTVYPHQLGVPYRMDVQLFGGGVRMEGQPTGGRVSWLGNPPNGLRVELDDQPEPLDLFVRSLTVTPPPGAPELPAGYVPIHRGVSYRAEWRRLISPDHQTP